MRQQFGHQRSAALDNALLQSGVIRWVVHKLSAGEYSDCGHSGVDSTGMGNRIYSERKSADQYGAESDKVAAQSLRHAHRVF